MSANAVTNSPGPALQRVMAVYLASDAEATRALYGDLVEHGAAGELAVNLLRASKKSERAKVYRGSRFRSASYDGKGWAMGEICRVLAAHPKLGLRWGWRVDDKQAFHSQVLYIDLPNGQVSFHAAQRGVGPEYPGDWDGKAGQSAQRVCVYAAQILEEER